MIYYPVSHVHEAGKAILLSTGVYIYITHMFIHQSTSKKNWEIIRNLTAVKVAKKKRGGGGRLFSSCNAAGKICKKKTLIREHSNYNKNKLCKRKKSIPI